MSDTTSLRGQRPQRPDEPRKGEGRSLNKALLAASLNLEPTQPWERELAQRNQKGAQVATLLVALLYPTFGLLDYVIAPPEVLTGLLMSRGFVVLCTVLMWLMIKRPLFAQRPLQLSALYMLIVGLGICVMVWSLGGLTSPYYAGLILVMIGSGLLFVWPLSTSLMVNLSLSVAWLLPQLTPLASPLKGEALISALSNGFFLFSAAAILTVAQSFNYERLKRQHSTRLALEQLSERLGEAHHALTQQEAFKSRFFANITHELKTPLALILSSLELLRQGELGETLEEQRSSVRQMERSGNKLLKLINDLLDVSKLEESQLRLKVAQHDLASWVREVLRDVSPLAERKELKVSLELSSQRSHELKKGALYSKVSLSKEALLGAEVMVFCDLERLERVLVNLLSNAIKFTPSGGQVTVRLRELEGRVRLEVEDSGQGFTPEQAALVFGRFYQTDMGATRKFGGSGLGLSLAKELIELHHGSIWATGQEGVGACFYVELLTGSAHFSERELAEGDAQARAQARRRESGEWRLSSPTLKLNTSSTELSEAPRTDDPLSLTQEDELKLLSPPAALYEPKQSELGQAELGQAEQHLTGSAQVALTPLPQGALRGAIRGSLRGDSTSDITLSVELNCRARRLAELEELSERRVVPRDEREDEREVTVLIAEDNPDITRMIHLALKRHFKVVTAPDGAKALELVPRFSPHLIITDLMMPVMDGIELVERLKADPNTSSIPVVMLSARDEIEQEMSARGCVADVYMSKPFSTRGLSKLARELVSPLTS